MITAFAALAGTLPFAVFSLSCCPCSRPFLFCKTTAREANRETSRKSRQRKKTATSERRKTRGTAKNKRSSYTVLSPLSPSPVALLGCLTNISLARRCGLLQWSLPSLPPSLGSLHERSLPSLPRCLCWLESNFFFIALFFSVHDRNLDSLSGLLRLLPLLSPVSPFVIAAPCPASSLFSVSQFLF